MVHGARYNLPFRRRREGRTDYKQRRGLVISGKPRFSVRPTTKHLSVQLFESGPKGDVVLAAAHSTELREFSWKAPCGNLPAAYLTGLLAGMRAQKKGIGSAVADIGLKGKTPGSRVFAAVKGAIDSGLAIPHDPEILPKTERIQGGHISKYASQLSPGSEPYRKAFSSYVGSKQKPEELKSAFEKTASEIKSKA